MSDAKTIHALTHVYDAAVNPGRWRRALDGVADVMGAKAIALLIRSHDPKTRDLNMVNSAYLDFARTPSGLFYMLWLSRLQRPDWDFLSRQPAHAPTPDTAIGPAPEELDARKDYAYLRRKIGVGRRLGVRLNSDKVWFDAMSIAFEKSHYDVPGSATRDLQLLLPH
ncbi:MAG: hypothetical protein AAFY59_10330, partial [Pseudomonadota bacterium]